MRSSSTTETERTPGLCSVAEAPKTASIHPCIGQQPSGLRACPGNKIRRCASLVELRKKRSPALAPSSRTSAELLQCACYFCSPSCTTSAVLIAALLQYVLQYRLQCSLQYFLEYVSPSVGGHFECAAKGLAANKNRKTMLSGDSSFWSCARPSRGPGGLTVSADIVLAGFFY